MNGISTFGEEGSGALKAVPWSQIGAVAGAQYAGEVLRIVPTTQGARVSCPFQRLDAEANRDGLWLTSTVAGPRETPFRVKAVAVGRRASSPASCHGVTPGEKSVGGGTPILLAGEDVRATSLSRHPLSVTGDVSVEGQTVRFTRPGLVEEYTVSMDGVRQDFLVLQKPGGVPARACCPNTLSEGRAPRGPKNGRGFAQIQGLAKLGLPTSPLGNTPARGRVDRLALLTDSDLRVELAVTGAHVQQTAYGAQLVLEQSGRKIAYSRLKVTDARGKELPARMELKSEIRNQKSEMGLVVVVNDTDAIYPVRIDPTFSDANWISLGGIRGANGPINAAAVDGMGNLYIGGSFTEVGDAVASGIAKWNGSAWSALGSGLGKSYPDVYALAVSGSNVYVGGSFTTAGGIPATNIARWDGSAWSPLGSGIGDRNRDQYHLPLVYALAVSDNNVYAGGFFTNVGGSSASYIAKWDGSAWSALGSGMDGDSPSSYPPVVRALAVSGSDVYAGGDFMTAGGIAANYIAKWDGSTWSVLGSGLGGPMAFSSGGVYALAVSGSNVYAGGYFTTADGSPATAIARWNGTAWSPLGSGTGEISYPPSGVTALAVSGNDVYAGWTTTLLCVPGGCMGGPAAITKWNGSTWSTLALEPTGEPGNVALPAVYALAASGSNLFAGGNFTKVGSTQAYYIADWDGSTWSALSSGMNGSVSAVAVSGIDLYAGGSFTTAGSVAANYIAKWDGNAWGALGSGMNDAVSALAVSGSNVYVGGQFTTAGGSPATNIAKWDGSAWSALGSGLNGSVSALAVSGSNLYAGGGFTTAGGAVANYIANWDGNAWAALGSGVSGFVNALAVSGKDLYVVGDFTTAGGVAANHVAKWDGNTWSALGSGVGDPPYVRALAVSGSNVYVGGYFTTAGGIAANNIAKWDGSAWSALGSGLGVVSYATVRALAVSGSDVYVGGDFTTAGGNPVNGIAKWDSSTWSALGSGVNGSVQALALSGSDLYAGGAFTTAGGKVSAYAAKAIIGPPPFYIVTTNSSIGFGNGQFSLTLAGPSGSNAVILASSNLQTWTPLVTNPLIGGSINFTDTFATNYTKRFYRAQLQP